MPKRATRKGVTPAKRSPKRKKSPPRAAQKPKSPPEKDEKPERGRGRPTDYEPRYCQELLDYFTPKPVEVKTVGEGRSAKILIEYQAMPMLEGFAAKIGKHRDTLHAWAKTYPEFSDAIKRAKEFQTQILTDGALRGHYNPTFSIFFAKNNLGWKDKVAVVGGDDDGDKPVQVTHDVPPEVKEAMARVSLRAKAFGVPGPQR